ncbi:hypothetical protein MTR67_044118 [Solanum verrucosum]|uniref:Uncharacterized protein n=1 Tax=Solanum verrucosum TaxID=315347 RepID=A0AAF0ZUZ6_SOLVR|nr:hypothetical protein MTR67_044118 [Solanum verrucosum]
MGKHCNIRKEENFDREDLTRIDCGNIYHIDCSKEWLKI